MHPSEKTRERSLKYTSPKTTMRMWAAILMFIAIVMLLTSFLVAPEKRIAMCIYTAAFLALISAVAYFIFRFSVRMLTKGIVLKEPVTENRRDFHTLCTEALKINNEDVPWQVEVHEKERWIDVTWRWKESFDIMTKRGLEYDTQVFYKFFRIYDDYTYSDLDFVTNTCEYLSLGNTGFQGSWKLGHFAQKALVINLSKNMADGTVGINEYEMNTAEMANYMHAWFAERGYRYRGL